MNELLCDGGETLSALLSKRDAVARKAKYQPRSCSQKSVAVADRKVRFVMLRLQRFSITF
jgi:hypothetical protein